MKYQKMLVIVFLITLSLNIFSAWPLPNEENKYISDIFSSWRGTSYWHRAIDIPVWNTGYEIYNINTGKILWIEQGLGYYNYIAIGDLENETNLYGHVTTETNYERFDEITSTNLLIGHIDSNSNYPHLHFEMIPLTEDTTDNGYYNNLFIDPLPELGYSYPMNLQKPEFFWLDANYQGGSDNFIAVEASENGGILNYGDYGKTEPYHIWGNITGISVLGCFGGIINDNVNRTNSYDNTFQIDVNKIFLRSNLYSDNSKPKFSAIYNLGVQYEDHSKINPIYWQIRGNLWEDEVSRNMSDENCINAIFKDPKISHAPFGYYLFTNISGDGDLHPDSLNVNYHWSTNMKQSLPGFYADPSNSDNFAKTNGEAKYQDGIHWVKVYATNYPTTDINDTAHVSMDSVPVLIDNFAPAYSSNYSLFNTFIFDTTTNQEYLLGSYNISQYDEFRVYDNMKLNLVLGPTESINENIVSEKIGAAPSL